MLAAQLYRRLDPTQEWAENNYYKLLIQQQTADLVGVNPFWLDYAKHDDRTPFLSRHLADSSRDVLQEYRLTGDWHLYAAAASVSRVAYLSSPLNIHRRHGSSVTATLSGREHVDEVRLARQSHCAREVGRLRRIADDVGLESRRFDTKLPPSSCHLCFAQNSTDPVLSKLRLPKCYVSMAGHLYW